MADGYIAVDADSVGQKVDMSPINVAGVDVVRQRNVTADPTDAAGLARVKNAAPLVGDYGQVVRVAGAVDVTGSVVSAVTGGLTDAQLRAAPVPVSGTFFQATQPVSGPLTDAQLRAAAVPVSGTFFQATQPVSGTFWQATQPVSVASLPLPTGAATEVTLALVAKDATLGLVSDFPGSYTVLDRLAQISKRLDANAKVIATEATLKLVAAALARPTVKPTTTLLHRSF